MTQFWDHTARSSTTLSIIQQTPPPTSATTDSPRDPGNQWSTQQSSRLLSTYTSLTSGLRLFMWWLRQAFGANQKGNLYCDQLYVVTDGILKAKSRSGGSQTLDGRWVSGGAVNFAAGPQTVTVASSAVETISVTLTGTPDGVTPQTETIAFAGAASATGIMLWQTISAVSLSGASAGVVRAGGSLGQRSYPLSIDKANNASFLQLQFLLGLTPPGSDSAWSGAAISLPGAATVTALGANPFTTAVDANGLGYNEVLVDQPGHGFPSTPLELIPVFIRGATGFNGLQNTDLNGLQYVDRATDANTWSLLTPDIATASGAGGGSGVTVTALTGAAVLLGYQPMTAVTVGQPDVRVQEPGHDRVVGEVVNISGVPVTGGGLGGLSGSYVNGGRTITSVGNEIINGESVACWHFNAAANFTISNSSGSNATVVPAAALVATSGSSVLGLRLAGHGLRAGETLTIASATGFAGIGSDALNTIQTVLSAPNNNIVTFDCGTVATSTAAGGGAFTVTPHYTLNTAQNLSWLAAKVTAIHVDAATAGHITVGGVYDGAAVVCASQKPTAGGNLTLVGGATVTLSQAQELVIASDANDSARTFTATIVNDKGQTVTFTLPSPNSGSLQAADNALASVVRNAAMPFVDTAIFAASPLPATVIDIDLDYECQDGRTTGITNAVFARATSLCHAASPPRRCHPYLDAVNAPSQSGNGVSRWMLPGLATSTDGLSAIVANNGPEGSAGAAARTFLAYFASLTSAQLAEQVMAVGFGPTDYTSVAADQAVSAANPLALQASEPVNNKSIVFFSTADDSARTFTINGTDRVQGPGPPNYFSVSPNIYNSFPTSITVDGACAGVISAGLTLAATTTGDSLEDILEARVAIDGTPMRTAMVWADYAVFGSSDPNDPVNQQLAAICFGPGEPAV